MPLPFKLIYLSRICADRPLGLLTSRNDERIRTRRPTAPDARDYSHGIGYDGLLRSAPFRYGAARRSANAQS